MIQVYLCGLGVVDGMFDKHSNLIFNPFAEKLQARNEENSHAHKLMIHGLLMIWKKRHPMDVKDMLISYVPHEERKQFLDKNE